MDRIQALLEFLQADPADSFSRYALGLEYLSLGERERAVETFEEVRRRDPDYLATYYQLGKARQECGDLAGAGEALRAGLEVAERQGDWHTHAELTEALDAL
ncbi:MAG: tetratricopeptide repeat protein [Candidatus Eremiobacterota bacterium]